MGGDFDPRVFYSPPAGTPSASERVAAEQDSPYGNWGSASDFLVTGLAGPPFYFRPDYVLDCLTLPQVLFQTLQKAEWEHEERRWQMQSLATAVAAGTGGKEAANAIERFVKQKLGQREKSFTELLAEERKRAGGH